MSIGNTTGGKVFIALSSALIGGSAMIATCVAVNFAMAPVKADTGSPEGVRVQVFQQSGVSCIVATHDTDQGASIAMWCR